MDYDDVDATAKSLELYNVHTIISAIAVATPEAFAAEMNLVKAASKSGSTKRFIASNWGVPLLERRVSWFART